MMFVESNKSADNTFLSARYLGPDAQDPPRKSPAPRQDMLNNSIKNQNKFIMPLFQNSVVTKYLQSKNRESVPPKDHSLI